MDTTWERITATTYATADWYLVVERTPEGWTVTQGGRVKYTTSTLRAAKAWGADFIAGRVLAY